ncbi:MAG: hypothetical protein ACREJ9_10705 [Candidatus Rokuibacteriota bacterium]
MPVRALGKPELLLRARLPRLALAGLVLAGLLSGALLPGLLARLLTGALLPRLLARLAAGLLGIELERLTALLIAPTLTLLLLLAHRPPLGFLPRLLGRFTLFVRHRVAPFLNGHHGSGTCG